LKENLFIYFLWNTWCLQSLQPCIYTYISPMSQKNEKVASPIINHAQYTKIAHILRHTAKQSPPIHWAKWSGVSIHIYPNSYNITGNKNQETVYNWQICEFWRNDNVSRVKTVKFGKIKISYFASYILRIRVYILELN